MYTRNANFAKGRSISNERRKLKILDENMPFKGGPHDKNYAKRLNRRTSQMRFRPRLEKIDEVAQTEVRPTDRSAAFPKIDIEEVKSAG